jgi:hypothetical protein
MPILQDEVFLFIRTKKTTTGGKEQKKKKGKKTTAVGCFEQSVK